MLHKRYLLWLLLLCCITLLPAVALNLLLLKHEGDVQSMSRAASEWQHRTHGITYTPTIGANGPFKTLRLNDRLADTDTVIFGSSTGMPIDSTMMPKGWHLYNFTQSGSPLSASISQAKNLVLFAPHIKHYIIALDWSLDFVYPPDPALLKKKSVSSSGGVPEIFSLPREALSYSRMAKLGDIFEKIAKSQHPQKTFREYFLQLGSDEYTCPDGKTLGKDFGIYNRGSCNGFRYDGSATYSDYNRIENVNRLIISAVNLGSKYAHALERSQGKLDHKLFDQLASLAKAIEKRGGKLILYMPPLAPGLERAFLQHPLLSTYLLETKRELAAWARDKPIILADFGQSENFGCTPEEFLDEHHADGTCYQKIFSVFWQNDAVLNKTTLNTFDARK